MSIKNEIKVAKQKYKFDEIEVFVDDKKMKLVRLTEENVYLAEAIYQILYGHYDLKIDEEQRKQVDKIEGEFCNINELDDNNIDNIRKQLNKIKNNKNIEMPVPSSFWFREIRDLDKADSNKYRFLLIGACHAVNRENSTHLKNMDLRVIVEEIINNYASKELMELLSKQDYGIISKLRELDGISDNYSFITKFCHYACFYMLDDNYGRDNYSIYDRILSDYIPYYYYYYVKQDGKCVKIPYGEIRKLMNEIKNSGNVNGMKNCQNSYDKYLKMINGILEKVDNCISRNGLDHLLWIYHRQ